MYLSSVLFLVLFPGMACAFSGGLFPVAHSTALHKRSKSQIGRLLGNNLDSARSIGDAGTSNTRRAAPRKLRAFPNEYEVFFNKASKSGASAITTLTPEERAQRAMEVGIWLYWLYALCRGLSCPTSTARILLTVLSALSVRKRHVCRGCFVLGTLCICVGSSAHTMAMCRGLPYRLNTYKRHHTNSTTVVSTRSYSRLAFWPLPAQNNWS